MSIDLNLAERIKLLRMFHGWTQEEMAEKLDLAASSYAKIERGQTDVPFSRLQQIAEVLGIKLADLFSLNEKNVFNIIGNSDTQAISHINIYTCQEQLTEFKEIIVLLKHT